MVFITADLSPAQILAHDTALDDLLDDGAIFDGIINEIHGDDDLSWLASPNDSESDPIIALSRSQSPSDIDIAWSQGLFNNEFDLGSLDSGSDSGLYSPVDSPTFTFLSDSDDSMKKSAQSMKRKVSDEYDDDEDDDMSEDQFTAKKARGKKPTAASLKARRANDPAVAKAIAIVRAEHTDGTDSRRRIHNVLERKRRDDLKSCYQDLRELIPELETCDRAPTGQILSKAVEYIEKLKREEQEIESALAAARAENERLRLGLM